MYVINYLSIEEKEEYKKETDFFLVYSNDFKLKPWTKIKYGIDENDVMD